MEERAARTPILESGSESSQVDHWNNEWQNQEDSCTFSTFLG